MISMRLWRFSFSAASALVLASAANGVQVQSSPTPSNPLNISKKQFSIPAQPLARALMEFSQQAGVTVGGPSGLVRGKRSTAVSGELAPESALSQLLIGTKLKVHRTDDGGLGLVDDPNGSTSSSGETEAGSAAAVYESADIIVTAQKREERLQDVPLSVSVLGGDVLDRYTGASVNEALSSTPGLTLNQGGLLSNGTVLNLRGVSAAAPTFGGGSAVAYYVDSVPFGMQRQAIVPDPNAYDLDRVEVLRGPQGTLYGASALNGVVRVLTHDANLQDFQLKTRVAAYTMDEGGESYRGDLAVNIPIVTDKLGARLVLGYMKAGGWIDRLNKKDANSGELYNARLKINAKPTENLSIGFSAWLSRSDYNASMLSQENNFYSGTLEQPQSGDFDAFGLKAEYQFSNFALSSVTSYVDYTMESLLDAGAIPGLTGTSYYTRVNSKVFAEELLLSSTGEGAWRWSLGGFFRHANDNTYQNGIFVVAPVNHSDKSSSMAAFGELTRIFADGAFELTGGLRYFHDRVKLDELLPNDGLPTTPLIHDRATFENVSPRVVLSWHPGDDVTIYGSFSKGFRSGISQSPIVTFLAPEYRPADPDKLYNYELGAKGSFLQSDIIIDAALFFIDWKNVQQTVGVPTRRGGQAATFINGVSASGWGLDLSLSLRPVRRLRFDFQFGWNGLGFDEPTLNPGTGAVVFGKGDRLGLSSEFTAGGSLDYSFPLAGDLEGGISGGARWQSSQSTRTINSGPTELSGKDIFTTQANVSIRIPDHWRASLFVDNLTNEQKLIIPSGIASWSTYQKPRTFGIQFDLSY